MSKRDLEKAWAYIQLKRAAEQAAHTVSREWDQKQREWRTRMAENIGRWTEQHNKNVAKIDRIDDNLDKLALRLKNSRGDTQKTKVESWINEDESRRKSLVTKNELLVNKIKEVEQKLAKGAPTPWFYREPHHGRAYGNFRIRQGLHLTKKEKERHSTYMDETDEEDESESAPVQQKSLLQILFGL